MGLIYNFSPMKITKDMQVSEVVLKYPQTVEIFFKHGIPAIACGAPIWGTIEENASKYGVDDLDKLIEELNSAVEDKGELDLRL